MESQLYLQNLGFFFIIILLNLLELAQKEKKRKEVFTGTFCYFLPNIMSTDCK